MAAITLIFDGKSVICSVSNTGWGNYNVGGGAPVSEPANAYQQDTPGSSVGAVGKKVTSTTSRQGVDYNGTSVNYSFFQRLWFCKVYIADSFDLNTTWGVEVSMGSANTSNYHQYNIAGSGANNDAYLEYPARGGYIITAINPIIDAWAENADVGGAFNQAAVNWYAVGAQFIGGYAKAENVAMDAIDYGTGLTITGGGSPDPVCKFTDFVEEDQNIKSNRWGVVNGSGNSMVARAILGIGSTAATQFFDDTTILTFTDGYINTGNCGLLINLTNALTEVQIGNTIIGEGRYYSGIAYTNPDLTVTGTNGIFRCNGTLRNFRNLTLTSACNFDGADVECELIFQNGAEIQNTTLRQRGSFTNTMFQSPTFGSTSGLHDTTFIKSDASTSRALRISSAGTYDFNNLFFEGYGANGSATSVLDITATSGTVTINVNGGDTPTYTSAGATVVINNTKTVKVIVLDAVTLNPVQGARVLLEAASGGPLSAGTDILSGLTDVNGVIQDTGFNYTANQPVTGRVRKATTSPLYQQGNITGTITVNGFETTVLLISDE